MPLSTATYNPYSSSLSYNGMGRIATSEEIKMILNSNQGLTDYSKFLIEVCKYYIAQNCVEKVLDKDYGDCIQRIVDEYSSKRIKQYVAWCQIWQGYAVNQVFQCLGGSNPYPKESETLGNVSKTYELLKKNVNNKFYDAPVAGSLYFRYSPSAGNNHCGVTIYVDGYGGFFTCEGNAVLSADKTKEGVGVWYYPATDYNTESRQMKTGTLFMTTNTFNTTKKFSEVEYAGNNNCKAKSQPITTTTTTTTTTIPGIVFTYGCISGHNTSVKQLNPIVYDTSKKSLDPIAQYTASIAGKNYYAKRYNDKYTIFNADFTQEVEFDPINCKIVAVDESIPKELYSPGDNPPSALKPCDVWTTVKIPMKDQLKHFADIWNDAKGGQYIGADIFGANNVPDKSNNYSKRNGSALWYADRGLAKATQFGLFTDDQRNFIAIVDNDAVINDGEGKQTKMMDFLEDSNVFGDNALKIQLESNFQRSFGKTGVRYHADELNTELRQYDRYTIANLNNMGNDSLFYKIWDIAVKNDPSLNGRKFSIKQFLIAAESYSLKEKNKNPDIVIYFETQPARQDSSFQSIGAILSIATGVVPFVGPFLPSFASVVNTGTEIFKTLKVANSFSKGVNISNLSTLISQVSEIATYLAPDTVRGLTTDFEKYKNDFNALKGTYLNAAEGYFKQVITDTVGKGLTQVSSVSLSNISKSLGVDPVEVNKLINKYTAPLNSASSLLPDFTKFINNQVDLNSTMKEIQNFINLTTTERLGQLSASGAFQDQIKNAINLGDSPLLQNLLLTGNAGTILAKIPKSSEVVKSMVNSKAMFPFLNDANTQAAQLKGALIGSALGYVPNNDWFSEITLNALQLEAEKYAKAKLPFILPASVPENLKECFAIEIEKTVNKNVIPCREDEYYDVWTGKCKKKSSGSTPPSGEKSSKPPTDTTITKPPVETTEVLPSCIKKIGNEYFISQSGIQYPAIQQNNKWYAKNGDKYYEINLISCSFTIPSSPVEPPKEILPLCIVMVNGQYYYNMTYAKKNGLADSTLLSPAIANTAQSLSPVVSNAATSLFANELSPDNSFSVTANPVQSTGANAINQLIQTANATKSGSSNVATSSSSNVTTSGGLNVATTGSSNVTTSELIPVTKQGDRFFVLVNGKYKELINCYYPYDPETPVNKECEDKIIVLTQKITELEKAIENAKKGGDPNDWYIKELERVRRELLKETNRANSLNTELTKERSKPGETVYIEKPIEKIVYQDRVIEKPVEKIVEKIVYQTNDSDIKRLQEINNQLEQSKLVLEKNFATKEQQISFLEQTIETLKQKNKECAEKVQELPNLPPEIKKECDECTLALQPKFVEEIKRTHYNGYRQSQPVEEFEDCEIC